MLHIYKSPKSTAKEARIALTISRDSTALKSRDLMKEDFRYLLGLEFQNVFLVSLLLHIYKSQKSAAKEARIALTISRDFTALKSRDLMKKDFKWEGTSRD